MAEWVATEVSHGRCKLSNSEGLEIQVFADFSGQILNSEVNEFMEFKDLRTVIEAADLLKKLLTDYYGGAK